MLLETMMICSLTIAAPYYDCSESWTLYLYDEYPTDFCSGFNACSKYNPPSIYYPVYQPQVWIDFCGLSLLEHELNHLKFKDNNYCHVDSPQAIYDKSGNLK
jgi:hypothetical protein